MTSIEQTGKTIEEATEKALEQLGVTEDEVDVEILEEAARGFLGLGQSPARVRVTLRPRPAVEEAPAPPARERRPRQRPAAREERPRQQQPAAREERPRQQPAAREERPRQQRPARVERPAPKPAAPAPVAVEETKAAPEAPRPAAPAPTPPVTVLATGEVLQSAAEISLEVLQRIVDNIEPGAKVGVKSSSEGQVVLEVTSADPATIIGKHGQTVDAIQYIVGVITNKRLPEKVRVVVDVEGYRTRREEALRNQAIFLASKVRESGEEAVLEPLQANERRIIHTALADDPDVYTYSEGEEPERYVVISPKKA